MNKADEEIVDIATLVGFLGGLLIGGVAGAGAMVLLAPQAGKETRRLMRRKVREVREQTTGTIEGGMARARTKAHDMSTSILEQTEALQQRGHEALDEGMERFATAVDAGKTAVKGS
jgi:gas vesicle protein